MIAVHISSGADCQSRNTTQGMGLISTSSSLAIVRCNGVGPLFSLFFQAVAKKELNGGIDESFELPFGGGLVVSCDRRAVPAICITYAPYRGSHEAREFPISANYAGGFYRRFFISFGSSFEGGWRDYPAAALIGDQWNCRILCLSGT